MATAGFTMKGFILRVAAEAVPSINGNYHIGQRHLPCL